MEWFSQTTLLILKPIFSSAFMQRSSSSLNHSPRISFFGTVLIIYGMLIFRPIIMKQTTSLQSSYRFTANVLLTFLLQVHLIEQQDDIFWNAPVFFKSCQRRNRIYYFLMWWWHFQFFQQQLVCRLGSLPQSKSISQHIY